MKKADVDRRVIVEGLTRLKYNIGGGGIFTKQCLDWCKTKFKGVHFDRIIIFSDSQDIDHMYNMSTLPEPFWYLQLYL